MLNGLLPFFSTEQSVLYVVDNNANYLRAWSPSGVRQNFRDISLGYAGQWFGATVLNDKIYVSANRGNKIAVWDLEGNRLSNDDIALGQNIPGATGIFSLTSSVDTMIAYESSRIGFTSTFNVFIKFYDLQGNELDSWIIDIVTSPDDLPTYIGVGATSDRIYLLRVNNFFLVAKDYDGNNMPDDDIFCSSTPVTNFVILDDIIYGTDDVNNMLLAYDLQGNYIASKSIFIGEGNWHAVAYSEQ